MFILLGSGEGLWASSGLKRLLSLRLARICPLRLSYLPPRNALPFLWHYQTSPAEGIIAGRTQFKAPPPFLSNRNTLRHRTPACWALPSFLLQGGGTHQDSHLPTKALFHFLLRQLTLLEGGSCPSPCPPGAQQWSCGLHPPSSFQGSAHTQAGSDPKTAASVGT